MCAVGAPRTRGKRRGGSWRSGSRCSRGGEAMTTLTKAPEAPVELSDSAQAFQLEVREWLEANAPSELKGLRLPRYRTSGEVKRLVEGWTERLGEAGFMCVARAKGEWGRRPRRGQGGLPQQWVQRPGVPPGCGGEG